MATVERAHSKGSQRANRIRNELGLEIRRARLEHGLSQTAVAKAARISKSQLSRIERGQNRTVSILVLALVLAALGMELSARAYPSGQPIRDRAHRALLEELHRFLAPGAKWVLERPLPNDEDGRAWDAGTSANGLEFGIDAETRLTDLQAFERRERLKLRDDRTVNGCLLVVADTRHNRSVLRANPDVFADFERLAPARLADLTAAGNRLVLL